MNISGSSTRELLLVEYDLIRLLYYRNKNQHRASTWFKHLCYLKSYLTRSIGHAQITKISPQGTADESLVLLSGDHEAFLSRCHRMYRDLSRLLEDGQYVPLASVLIGSLARIYHLLKHDNAMRHERDDKSTGALPSNAGALSVEHQSISKAKQATKQGHEEGSATPTRTPTTSKRNDKKKRPGESNSRLGSTKKARKPDAIDAIFGS